MLLENLHGSILEPIVAGSDLIPETDILGITEEEHEDPVYSGVRWGLEALNPISIVDPRGFSTKRGRAQKVFAYGLTRGALWSMYALSGGGTTHHVARALSRPGPGTPWLMKADAIRAVSSGARTVGHAAGAGMRGAIRLSTRALPAVTFGSVLFAAGNYLQDAYFGLAGMHIGDLRFVR